MTPEIRLVTVGQTRNREFGGSVEEYLRRCNQWVRASWVVVPARDGAALDAARTLQRAGEGMPRGREPVLVLLDEGGTLVTSEEFSLRLEGWLNTAARTVVFLIGGASGVSKSLRERADWCWSLSPMTLPHGLAAVVATEQLYRALTIQHGHPYHIGH